MKKILIYLVILCVSSCGLLKKAEKNDSDLNNLSENKSMSKVLTELINFDVEKFTLDNGLKVLLVKNSKLPLVSYYMFVNVGSKDEPKGRTGSSHYLEHLLFKNVKNKQGRNIFDKEIESIGGSTNAFTSRDVTVYYENFPKKGLSKVLDLESTRLKKLNLNDIEFNTEKNVILNERKYRYENSPRGKLYLRVQREMFKSTPYETSVIGVPKDIINITKEQVNSYFKKYYSPSNLILVISGDINSSKVKKEIKSKFGKLKNSFEFKNKDLKKTKYEPKPILGRNIHLHGETENPMFNLSYKGIKLGERKSYVLDLLSTMIGEGRSSYLTKRFVYSKKPLLSSLYTTNSNQFHSGTFNISGVMLRNVNIKRFKRVLVKELKKSCNSAISKRTLQKSKNQYLVGYFNGLQTNADVALFLGYKELYFNDYNYFKKELEIYDSITLDEVRTECKKLFHSSKNLYVTIWNKSKKI